MAEIIRDRNSLVIISRQQKVPDERVREIVGYLGPKVENPQYYFSALTDGEWEEVNRDFGPDGTLEDPELYCEIDGVKKHYPETIVPISNAEHAYHRERLENEQNYHP